MTPWELLWEWIFRYFPVPAFLGSIAVWSIILVFGAYKLTKWRYHHTIKDHLPALARAEIRSYEVANRWLKGGIKARDKIIASLLGQRMEIRQIASRDVVWLPYEDELDNAEEE